MALQPKAAGRQWPLVAEVVLKLGTDAVINADGVKTALNAASVVSDLVPLPPGAVVIGGDVTVDTVSNETGTATIAVGDSGNATRYLPATSTKAVARTALTLTGFRGNGEDVRVTLANQNGNATAGTVSLRVMYVVQDRANEVQPS